MRRSIFQSGFVLLTIMLMTTTANAQPAVSNIAVDNRPTFPSISAFDLAAMAYQGTFRNQGISGYGFLVAAHNQGQVSAKDVVQAAINANRLPAAMINNQGFLNAVEANLRAFKSNSF